MMEKILDLIDTYSNYSWYLGRVAEKNIILICEPVIKEYWELSEECGYKLSEYMNFPDEYIPYCGFIHKISGVSSDSIKFIYRDFDNTGREIYEVMIRMPLDWLIPESKEKYRILWKSGNRTLENLITEK